MAAAGGSLNITALAPWYGTGIEFAITSATHVGVRQGSKCISETAATGTEAGTGMGAEGSSAIAKAIGAARAPSRPVRCLVDRSGGGGNDR